jgi:hypothetical protein
MLPVIFASVLLTVQAGAQEPRYSANNLYKLDTTFSYHECHNTEEKEEEWENFRFGPADEAGRCLDDSANPCLESLTFAAFGGDEEEQLRFVPRRVQGPDFCTIFEAEACQLVEIFPAARGKDDSLVYRQQLVQKGNVVSRFQGEAPMKDVLDKVLRYQITLNGCSFFEVKLKLNVR